MYCREQNLTDILKVLWTFTTVQHRMILQESLTTRQADKDPVSPLFRLAREAVLLRLSSVVRPSSSGVLSALKNLTGTPW